MPPVTRKRTNAKPEDEKPSEPKAKVTKTAAKPKPRDAKLPEPTAKAKKPTSTTSNDDKLSEVKAKVARLPESTPKNLPKPTTSPKPTVSPKTESSFVQLFAEERRKTAASILEFKFNKSRARVLNDLAEVPSGSNGIIYWMFRDQRVQDNWAFLFAQKLALKNKVPLHVCFCLLPKFLDANTRHYRFLVKGLQEIEAECEQLNVSFHLFYGNGGAEVPKFVRAHSMGAVVCDFCPLRVPLQWIEQLKKDTPPDIPIIQIDAHNIVPVWIASDKQEYAARTIRNKIVKKLEHFLTEFPPVTRHPHDSVLKKIQPNDWVNCWKHVDIPELDEVEWAVAGYAGGIQQLEEFCLKRLKHYSTKKNDPTEEVLSDLAPWFHFGRYFSENEHVYTCDQLHVFIAGRPFPHVCRPNIAATMRAAGGQVQVVAQGERRRVSRGGDRSP